jgi:hypothetical protein
LALNFSEVALKTTASGCTINVTSLSSYLVTSINCNGASVTVRYSRPPSRCRDRCSPASSMR